VFACVGLQRLLTFADDGSRSFYSGHDLAEWMKSYERAMEGNMIGDGIDDAMNCSAYVGCLSGYCDAVAFLAKEYARDPKAANFFITFSRNYAWNVESTANSNVRNSS